MAFRLSSAFDKMIKSCAEAFAQPSFRSEIMSASTPIEVPSNPADRAEYFRAKAEERRQENEELQAILQNAIADGIQFIHRGPVTIAYVQDQPGDGNLSSVGRGRVVYFSTALCHPNDQFAKWKGSAYAAKSFNEGHHVVLKVPKDYESPRTFLETIAELSIPIEDMPSVVAKNSKMRKASGFLANSLPKWTGKSGALKILAAGIR